MKSLSDNMTLKDYQEYLNDVVKQRGFDKESITEVFMIFIEEVGELAKAHRKASGLGTDKNSRVHKVEEEAADVFFMLIDLCNRLDIDLTKAFLDKEQKNQNRNWA